MAEAGQCIAQVVEGSKLGVAETSLHKRVDNPDRLPGIRPLAFLTHLRMVAQTISRYNLPMPRTAAELLEEVRHLPPAERDWLIENLLGEESAISDAAFAAWQKEAGEPEAGYEEWFRASVEVGLADDPSGDVPHEKAMQHLHQAILKARRLKNTA